MRGPFFMPFFANRYNLIPIIVQQHVGPVPLSRFILGIQPTFGHIPYLKSKIFSNNLATFTATSEKHQDDFHVVVIRWIRDMPSFATSWIRQ